MKKQYSCIGMGGTFDRLHIGHQEFIAFAAALAERVVIGVTDQKMIGNKQFAHRIEPLKTRLATVQSFCANQKITAEVVELHDIYGPTMDDAKIVALAVTTDSMQGGKAINEMRQSHALIPLPTHIFQLVRDDSNTPITSTRIRSGEIDRNGNRYAKLLEQSVTVTERQRAFLSQPLGPIVTTAPKVATALTYVVGDVCLANFHKNSWDFHAGWYDNKTMRTIREQPSWPTTHTISNPAGTITKATTKNIVAIISEHSQLWSLAKLPLISIYTLVHGEEDLCTLGLVLLSPLGTNIYYGQPNQGMVQLTVTETLKLTCVSILKK